MTGVDQDDVAAPAPSRWYLRVRGEARGPLSEDSVRALLSTGEVHGDTPVSPTPEGPRRPLRDEPSLRALLVAALSRAPAHESDMWFDLPPVEVAEPLGGEVLQAEPLPDHVPEDLPDLGAGALPDLGPDTLEGHPDPSPEALGDVIPEAPAILPPEGAPEASLGPTYDPAVDEVPAQPADLAHDVSVEPLLAVEAFGLPLDPDPEPLYDLAPVAGVSLPPVVDPPSAFSLATAIHDAEPESLPAVQRPTAGEGSSARARVNVRGPRFTGHRNEDSILFSVSGNLGAGRASSVPPPAAPVTDRDSSGLIDISRLAGTPSPLSRTPSARPSVDGLLTVGASGALQPPRMGGLLAPPVPPPMRAVPTAPASSEINKTVVLSAALVALIITTGVCAVVYLLHHNGPQIPPDPLPSAVALAPSARVETSPAPLPAPSVPGAEAPAAPSLVASSPPTAASAVHAPVAGRPGALRPMPPPARPAEVHTQPLSAHGHGASAHARPVETETTPSYHAPVETTGENLPDVPSRAAVVEALQAVSAVVRACGSGAEPATVDMTFASSGRITTATVRAPYAGTPTGSCVARSVRAARLAPFSQPTFRVAYPFSLP